MKAKTAEEAICTPHKYRQLDTPYVLLPIFLIQLFNFMTWEEVKELGPLYAIGALESEQMQQVENFLRQATAEQQREFAQWQEVAALMPLSLPQATPSANLKNILLSQLASQGNGFDPQRAEETKILPFRSKQRVSPQVQRWLLAASIVLMSSTAYLAWQNYQIVNQLRTSELQLSTLQRQFENFLSPSTKVISMNGVETPGAHAKVVWNTETQTWEVHIKNLPAPPTDKDYQLWYVTADAKINAAVFRTGANGSLELNLTIPPEALKGLAATAVTLEPKGGSVQPTGKFYLMAKI
ncbi:MAG TPA: anti-sigma factor [Blastocatellia bacterium]|nr:anti-sigma factor [Blastocatellia bacterium]